MKRNFIALYWPLILLLFLSNGMFLWLWILESSNTNEVGKQWIRLIFPAIMIVSSMLLTGVYVIVKRSVSPKTGQGNPGTVTDKK